jgi:hypothetical protein
VIRLDLPLAHEMPHLDDQKLEKPVDIYVVSPECVAIPTERNRANTYLIGSAEKAAAIVGVCRGRTRGGWRGGEAVKVLGNHYG